MLDTWSSILAQKETDRVWCQRWPVVKVDMGCHSETLKAVFKANERRRVFCADGDLSN